jgi:hypothetical protein
MKKALLIILLIPLFISGCATALPVNNSVQPASTSTVQNQPVAANPTALLGLPLDRALDRVTKKPFGIYVSPGHSPVSPEKFSGYHTGADFEILPGEENIDVSVSIVCAGKLLLKKYASGYGGVAVQSCKLEGQDVTIIYGHLRLSSITPIIGDQLKTGDHLGVLGKGYSVETDGERKHLHLGIHKGTAISILGYVQNSTDLSNWLDPLKYLK